MTFRPLISVCMPVYNTEQYLSQAIASVLAQSYDHLELIVCDNYSTDRSPQIAQEFASDPRVRFIANARNVGFAGNMQKVTSLARGQLLTIIGADDVMLPDTLAIYVHAIEESGLDPENLVVIADHYLMDDDGRSYAVAEKIPGRFEYEQRPVGTAARGG